MLIAQLTDIHIGFEAGNPDEPNMQRLRAVVARLREGPNRPDLVLLTGDLTEFGDAESFGRLVEAVGGFGCPVWPMTGNHDDRAALLTAFPATPVSGGFVHYALELQGLRVILLDTLEPGRHGGAFCDERAVWLRHELAAHPDTPTVIAMHHPPFESGIAWLDSDGREPWIARFGAAIAGQPQVRAIIAGHLHRTIHTQFQGVPLTVCSSVAPAVGLDLNPVDADRPDGRAAIVDEPPSYALHRWDGERLVSHFEAVAPHAVLARYDERFQPTVRVIQDERSVT